MKQSKVMPKNKQEVISYIDIICHQKATLLNSKEKAGKKN